MLLKMSAANEVKPEQLQAMTNFIKLCEKGETLRVQASLFYNAYIEYLKKRNIKIYANDRHTYFMMTTRFRQYPHCSDHGFNYFKGLGLPKSVESKGEVKLEDLPPRVIKQASKKQASPPNPKEVMSKELNRLKSCRTSDARYREKNRALINQRARANYQKRKANPFGTPLETEYEKLLASRLFVTPSEFRKLKEEGLIRDDPDINEAERLSRLWAQNRRDEFAQCYREKLGIADHYLDIWIKEMEKAELSRVFPWDDNILVTESMYRAAKEKVQSILDEFKWRVAHYPRDSVKEMEIPMRDGDFHKKYLDYDIAKLYRYFNLREHKPEVRTSYNSGSSNTAILPPTSPPGSSRSRNTLLGELPPANTRTQDDIRNWLGSDIHNPINAINDLLSRTGPFLDPEPFNNTEEAYEKYEEWLARLREDIDLFNRCTSAKESIRNMITERYEDLTSKYDRIRNMYLDPDYLESEKK